MINEKFFQDPGLMAATVSLITIIVTKILDWVAKQAGRDANEVTEIRKELRKQVQELTEQLRECEERYYDCREENINLRAANKMLEVSVERMLDVSVEKLRSGLKKAKEIPERE